jgi:hypothetical protein
MVLRQRLESPERFVGCVIDAVDEKRKRVNRRGAAKSFRYVAGIRGRLIRGVSGGFCALENPREAFLQR